MRIGTDNIFLSFGIGFDGILNSITLNPWFKSIGIDIQIRGLFWFWLFVDFYGYHLKKLNNKS